MVSQVVQVRGSEEGTAPGSLQQGEADGLASRSGAHRQGSRSG